MGDANSCCRVLTGLVVARMPLLLRILVSGSVTPLMYGKTAKPFWESGGSAHLKKHSHTLFRGRNDFLIMTKLSITILSTLKIIIIQYIKIGLQNRV